MPNLGNVDPVIEISFRPSMKLSLKHCSYCGNPKSLIQPATSSIDQWIADGSSQGRKSPRNLRKVIKVRKVNSLNLKTFYQKQGIFLQKMAIFSKS